MEETTCIFKTKKSRCKSSPRMDLPLLICQHHLKQYYGLELGHVEIDDISHVSFAGSFLKPIKGFSIFSRNEVIIPTKQFLDLRLRPNNSENKMYKSYTLNKRIEENIRQYGISFPDTMDDRHVIEMYRNFVGAEIVDPDPEMTHHYPKLQAAVESSKTQSAVYIRNQPVSKTLNHNYLYVGTDEINIHTNSPFSINFQYLLNNCLYSEMEISYNEGNYIDHIPANTTYVKDVGLVATEQIADPLYLILDGRTSGSQVFYQAHVGLLQKQIQEIKYSVKDIPKQYILNEAWKSGKLC